MKKFFRTPKNGEWIQYDCGCIYEIEKVKGKVFRISPNVLCIEHDPTLTEYAKEHEEEIAEAVA